MNLRPSFLCLPQKAHRSLPSFAPASKPSPNTGRIHPSAGEIPIIAFNKEYFVVGQERPNEMPSSKSISSWGRRGPTKCLQRRAFGRGPGEVPRNAFNEEFLVVGQERPHEMPSTKSLWSWARRGPTKCLQRRVFGRGAGEAPRNAFNKEPLVVGQERPHEMPSTKSFWSWARRGPTKCLHLRVFGHHAQEFRQSGGRRHLPPLTLVKSHR